MCNISKIPNLEGGTYWDENFKSLKTCWKYSVVSFEVAAECQGSYMSTKLEAENSRF